MSSFRGRGRGHPKKPPGLHSRLSGSESNGNHSGVIGVSEPPQNAATATIAESAANECFVCCRDIKVFAVGVCDHPVCHVCSTRLRVLCETNECPVCRAVMDEVVFVAEVSTFENLKSRQFPLKHVEKFGISFENDDIFENFNELLTNQCNECIRRANIAKNSGERSHPPKYYENFESLRDHVLRDHKRRFCDLCVEHLKLFTFERQAYSKCDLRRHLAEGDLNDKSHRGHPRCDFCQTHYLDKDELYKHLKLDHFSCFICQQGNAACRLLQYYATYEDLRQHFSRDHFLCEQGDCATERFVAFATKLDYKAHTATNHSDTLSREEQRAARDLAVDFAMSPPARDSLRGEGGSSAGSRRGNRDSHRDRFTAGRERGRRLSPENQTSYEDTAPSVDTTSTKDFPSLLGDSAVNRPLIPTPKYAAKMTTALNSAEEFPSLGKPSNPGPSYPATWCKPVSKSKTPQNPIRVTASSASVRSAPPPSKPSNSNQLSDLFPSLPQPSSDSDFGKLLKPLPRKKQYNDRQGKAVHEKRSVVESSVSVQAASNANSKSRQQISNFNDMRNVPKNSVTTKAHEFTTVGKKQLNSANTSAFWSTDEDTGQDKQQLQLFRTEKKVNTAKAKLPKQEDFPSLGPAKSVVGASSDFQPARTKEYKGIKPGEWGQESRSNDQFIEPPNFTKRTTELMGMLKLLFHGQAVYVTRFRVWATSFRKGFITAEDFVESCIAILDDCSGFTKVFVEIVCLTPDIKKQNELIVVYDNLKKVCGSQKKTNARDWVRCSQCGQITIPEDTQHHQKAHC